MTYADARALLLALPAVEEGTAHGRPAFRLKGKYLAGLNQHGALVVRVPLDEKDALLAAHPDVLWTTPHYEGYGAVLVRIEVATPDFLKPLVERGWDTVAPKRMRR